jgi:glycerol-3-phosphate dehydrogenase (NAD(P)+)
MVEASENIDLTVIGAGAWGTALANLLAEKGHGVTLWAYEPDLSEDMARKRVNTVYLPDFPIHPNITPTSDLSVAAHSSAVFVSVMPSHTVKGLWTELGAMIPQNALVVSATKGIEAESLLTISQILANTIPTDKQVALAVLSGPSFAHEVSRQAPAAVVTAAADRTVAERVQQLFSTPQFRVYSNTDVLGVELGGALKNVMALAAGVCDGLQFGNNARAAVITRGLAEMTRLGLKLGGSAETFAGLTGMGDLVLTCTGELSRNHMVGVQLGQGKTLEEVMQTRHTVAEGVTTAVSAVGLGTKYGVEMPIAESVYALLQARITPRDAVTALMTRTLKKEDI